MNTTIPGEFLGEEFGTIYTRTHRPRAKRTPKPARQSQQLREIEIDEMERRVAAGELRETERGAENVYFKDADEQKYFCKCL